MAKLLAEYIDAEDLEVIAEGTGAKKSWYISGPAIICDQVNKNGRIYRSDIVAKDVERFDREMIQTGKALGEMSHPQSPSINYERASHIIQELRRDGNTWIMKAKLLETPCGKIAQALLAEGVPLGCSSRGLGSVSKRPGDGALMVGNDFRLATIDLVSQPSGPGCWTEGLYESADYEFIDGEWVQTSRRQPNRDLYTEQTECFQRFLATLS